MFNALRTSFLLAALTGLFMAVGYLIGGTTGMVMALGVALMTNLFAYWNSDKMVLSMQNASQVSEAEAPELYRLVARLAKRADLPMPKLYLIHADQPNAFATGRNPENAAVAVSTGLLHTLDTRELAGVIAHELAHIRNRDTLTMTVTATLAGAISMLAQFGFFFGGLGGRNNNGIGPIGALAMMILAPLGAMLVQMAVSRTREYEADRQGAKISGDPLALASALAKISRIAHQVHNPTADRIPGMAHLFIINPLAGARMDNLFATHPATENRIAALQHLAEELGPANPVTAGRDTTPHRAPTPRAARTGQNSGWRVPPTGGPDETGPRGPWG